MSEQKKEPKYVVYDLTDNEAYLFDSLRKATAEAKSYAKNKDFTPDEYIIAKLEIVRKVKREISVTDA